MEVPQKAEVELPYDLAISLLSMYPENMKTVNRRDICTPVFIAVLFTTAKTWKQLKCLSSVKQIKM